MNPLKSLADHGQAVWLDFLSRGFIAKGGLKKLADDDGLRGVTSNPSIFEQAIGHSDEYDAAIARMLQAQDRSVGEIFEHLAVEDIQQATDVLRPTYEATHGADGYVSIEVSPYLAKDTQGTIDEARRLWREVGRKNLMIKVPGTPEGMPAIHDLIAGGINVNITLLFAQAVYEQVVEAYLSGLEVLAAKGGDISQIASVASFFVSRIDTAVDKLLDEKIAQANDPDEKARLKALKGKIAVANAKLAYQRYKRLFDGARWQALAAKGAKTQRLLWASTGTKNKAYSDVLYVEELIGPDTVNTIPIATMDAFRDHGKIADTIEDNVADAQRVLGDLGRAGISLDAVTDKLVEEGVRLFADAADKLFAAVAEKRGKILDGKIDTQMLALGDASDQEGRCHGGGVAQPRQCAKTLAARHIAVDRHRRRSLARLARRGRTPIRSRATKPLPRRSGAKVLPMRFFSAWAAQASARKSWRRCSATSKTFRACTFSIPPCRRRSRRSRARSISARHCSSCRASRAPRPSPISSRIIFSSASPIRSAKRRPAGTLSPSPIQARRWSKRPRRKIFARYSSACPASAGATPCCRRSAWCRPLSPASTSQRWKSRRA